MASASAVVAESIDQESAQIVFLKGADGTTNCLVRGVVGPDRCSDIWARMWRGSDHDEGTDPTKAAPNTLAIGERGGLPNQERRNYNDLDPDGGTGGSMCRTLTMSLFNTISGAKTVVGGDASSLHSMFKSTLDPWFKLSEYSKGGKIPRHRDAINPYHERYFTVLFYLSDFEGGRTFFPDTGEYVNAKKGDVLIFEGYKVPHACEEVTKGPKRIVFTTIPIS